MLTKSSTLNQDFEVLGRTLTSDHAHRKLILDCCFMLHNFRCTSGAPNQIKTTFSAGHLRPLVARASAPLSAAMFGIETGQSASSQAFASMIENVRRGGGAAYAFD